MKPIFVAADVKRRIQTRDQISASLRRRLPGLWSSAKHWVILHVLLVSLLAGTVQAREDSANTFFQDGLAASQAGQYAKAARAFRDSLAHQPATGTLLNLGLAEWR